eukprot:6456822-Amphidinium_carterae.1
MLLNTPCRVMRQLALDRVVRYLEALGCCLELSTQCMLRCARQVNSTQCMNRPELEQVPIVSGRCWVRMTAADPQGMQPEAVCVASFYEVSRSI